MAWVFLDDNFPNHPKATQAGPVAAYLYVCGLCYCRRFHTDGFIPKHAIASLGVSTRPVRMIAALVDAGLWDVVDGGWRIHDYQEFYADQFDKELRAQRREAGRRGGVARAQNQAAKPRLNFGDDGFYWIYCAKSPDEKSVKVGVTASPQRRDRQLRSNPPGLIPVYWWKLATGNRAEAFSIEASVHVALRSRFVSLSNETFEASVDDCADVVTDVTRSSKQTSMASSTERVGTGLGSSSLRKEGELETPFDQFWAIYPRADGKRAAFEKWTRISPDADTQARIMADIARRKRSRDWTKDGGQFIPHASTYLHGRRWEDGFKDVEAPQVGSAGQSVLETLLGRDGTHG